MFKLFGAICLLMACACTARAQSVFPPANNNSGGASVIACIGTPGNTVAAYRVLCQTAGSTPVQYQCANSGGCTVAADWFATGSAASAGTNTLQKSNGSGGFVSSSITDAGTTVVSTEPINSPSSTTGSSPPPTAWQTGTMGMFGLADGTNAGTVPAGASFLGSVSGVPNWLTSSAATPFLISSATGMQTFLTTPSGANLASILTSAIPLSVGGTNATSAAAALINLFPTATRAGDVIYCVTFAAGACSSWALLAGNNSGTQYFGENASGVAAWGTPSGGSFAFPITVSGTTVSGGIPYLSNTTTLTSSALLTLNRILLGGGAGGAPTSDAKLDDGVTAANTLTYTGTGGMSASGGPVSVGTAPACTAGTAGAYCQTEGTAFTNVASTAGFYADSTAHEFIAKTNGASTGGIMVRAQPGAIRSTGLAAAVTTATLCAASAGACNTAGQYHVHINLFQTGTACTSNATGGVSPSLTWTDGNGTAHSAQGIPMDTNASLTAVTGTMLWNASTLGAWGSGDVNIDTNGSVIQYAIAFAQCSVSGTATYSADLAVTRIQ